MSPDTNKTLRTALYVVGGLVVVSTVAGIIIFAVGAHEATKLANAGGKQVTAGLSGYPLPAGDLMVIQYQGALAVPTIAQVQAALDASTSPGLLVVRSVDANTPTFSASGAFSVSAVCASGAVVTPAQLTSGFPAPGQSWNGPASPYQPSPPAISVVGVQDFGSTGA